MFTQARFRGERGDKTDRARCLNVSLKEEKKPENYRVIAKNQQEEIYSRYWEM